MIAQDTPSFLDFAAALWPVIVPVFLFGGVMGGFAFYTFEILCARARKSRGKEMRRAR